VSLHMLQQVIVALHEKAKGKRQHIPYRNSMITSVLKDSIGGNCMVRKKRCLLSAKLNSTLSRPP
jgi:hypothetical protein